MQSVITKSATLWKLTTGPAIAEGPRDALSFEILRNAAQMVEELRLRSHAASG